MSQDFSKLSYKQLQALAVKQQIPGNIKKNLLVDFLRAVECGDEVQVSRMMNELKENRKRKARKRKLEKMTAVTATPMYSPNYSSIEDRFYSPQHLSPFRWATPEEEMIRREDPHYEIFRQYLIQRIQKNHQNFDANNNDVGVDASASNMKANPFDSNPVSNFLLNSATNTIIPSPDAHHSSSQAESQTGDEANVNKSMILQKMLQAPLGTNLGAMARLGANQVWSNDHCHPLREIEDNNSDTLTCGSESIDDDWEEQTDFHNIFGNHRTQNIFGEQNQIPQFSLEQMMNYFQNNQNNQNGYQYNNQINYAPPNVQENCQTWIESNSLDYKGPMDCLEINDSPNMYNFNSEEEQTNFQHQTGGSLSVFEQNNYRSENNGIQAQNASSYYQHQFPQQVQSFPTEYHDQMNYFNSAPSSTNVTQLFSASQTQDSTYYGNYSQGYESQMPCSGATNCQYPMYSQNQQNYQPPSNSLGSNLAQFIHNSQAGEQNLHLRPSSGSAVQRGENNSLGPFWPKYSDRNSGGFHLENILTLNSVDFVDHAKFNQTSSVYCYAPPLCSPVEGTLNSQNIERVELVTAGRSHSFTSKSLIYSDSNSGMKMTKLPADILEDQDSGSCCISLGNKSDASYHNEPIQEVWVLDSNNIRENDSESISSSYGTISE